MKKIVLIIEAILVISVIFPNISYAEKESEQTTISTQDILSSQQDSLNISSFLKEAKSTQVLYMKTLISMSCSHLR